MPLLSRVFMALGAVFALLSVALSAAAAHVPALQQGGAAFAGASALGFPAIVRAQAAKIKIGHLADFDFASHSILRE